jgi:hypothetical protein
MFPPYDQMVDQKYLLVLVLYFSFYKAKQLAQKFIFLSSIVCESAKNKNQEESINFSRSKCLSSSNHDLVGVLW